MWHGLFARIYEPKWRLEQPDLVPVRLKHHTLTLTRISHTYTLLAVRHDDKNGREEQIEYKMKYLKKKKKMWVMKSASETKGEENKKKEREREPPRILVI